MILLALVFDSGLFGDAALHEVGRHGGAEIAGQARVRSGAWQAFEPAAVHLRTEGAPLLVRIAEGRLLFETGGGNGSVATDCSLAVLAERIGGLDLAGTELRADLVAESLGDETAGGILTALGSTRVWVREDRPATLGWALEGPFLARFGKSIGRLLRFDFGVSARTGQPIAAHIGRRFGPSLALALPAFLLTTCCALFFGLVCAARHRRFTDRGLVLLAVVGMSIPSLTWILVLQKVLAADLGWFEVFGWEAPYLPHLTLPVLIWVVVGFGPELRFYRTVFLEELDSDWVRAARAQGLSESSIQRRLLRSSLVPVLTRVVVVLPFLFTGSLLLERFFGIPGLGSYTVEAVLGNDPPVVRAMTFLFTLAFIAADTLTDLAWAWVDPRVRLQR